VVGVVTALVSVPAPIAGAGLARPDLRQRWPSRRVAQEAEACVLSYLNPRREPKLLSRDEAFLIAVNIAKLPSVPRQILQDIPRPPNSASRDDGGLARRSRGFTFIASN
jgi:hypothetical protein